METDFDTVAKSLPIHIRQSLVDDPIQLDPVGSSHIEVHSRAFNPDANRVSSIDRQWYRNESVMGYPMQSQGAKDLSHGPLTRLSTYYTRNLKESEQERQQYWLQKAEEEKLKNEIVNSLHENDATEQQDGKNVKEAKELETFNALKNTPYVMPESRLPETQFPLQEMTLRDVCSTSRGAYSKPVQVVSLDDEFGGSSQDDRKVANYLNSQYAQNRERENALERSLAHSKAASRRWLEGLGKLGEETARIHEAQRSLLQGRGKPVPMMAAKQLVPAGTGAMQTIGLGSSVYTGHVGQEVQQNLPPPSFTVNGQYLPRNTATSSTLDLTSKTVPENSVQPNVKDMQYAVMEAWTAHVQGKNVLKVDSWAQVEADQTSFTTAARLAGSMNHTNVDEKPISRSSTRPRTQENTAEPILTSLDLIRAQSLVQVQLALQRRLVKDSNGADENHHNQLMFEEEEEALRKKLQLSGFSFSTVRNFSKSVTLTQQLPYNQFSVYDSSTGSVKQPQYSQEVVIVDEAQRSVDEEPRLVLQKKVIQRVPTGSAAPAGVTSNAFRASRAEERRKEQAEEKKRREEDPDTLPDLQSSPRHQDVVEEAIELKSARLYGGTQFGIDHIDLLVQQSQSTSGTGTGNMNTASMNTTSSTNGYTYNPLASKTFILDVAPPPRPPMDPKEAKRLALQKRMGGAGGSNSRKKEMAPLPVVIPKYKSEMIAEPLRPVLIAPTVAHHTLPSAPARLGEGSVDVGNHKTTVKVLNPTVQASVHAQDPTALQARAERAQALVEAEKVKLALAQNKVSVTSHALEQAFAVPIPILSKQEKTLFATSMNGLVMDPQVIKVKKVKRRVKK